MGDADHDAPDGMEPLASCAFHGSTIEVYRDRVCIERSKRSGFAGKEIPMAEIRDVRYSPGLVSGYLQIDSEGVDLDGTALFTHPVDENTVHFPRNGRSCATRVRDEILQRMAGD